MKLIWLIQHEAYLNRFYCFRCYFEDCEYVEITGKVHTLPVRRISILGSTFYSGQVYLHKRCKIAYIERDIKRKEDEISRLRSEICRVIEYECEE